MESDVRMELEMGMYGPGNGSLRGRTLALIKKYGFSSMRRLGQNFLVDERYILRIVEAAGLTVDDLVLEVGPGFGFLTEALASRAGRVIAVELDRRLISILEERFAGHPGIELIHGDILKVNLTELLSSGIKSTGSCKVVANLPYYITTPVIMKFLESWSLFKRIVITVQKEVAFRMTAGPGGKEYGAFSIAVQFRSVPEIVEVVPRSSFFPEPEVDSAIVRLEIRREPAVGLLDEAAFFAIVRAGFGKRRKTLRNALKGAGELGIGLDALEEAFKISRIDPARRAETLGMEEFARLADAIASLRGMHL